MPNQSPSELEAKILEITERSASASYLRISQRLGLIGVGGVALAGEFSVGNFMLAVVS